jgi:hypothetical protein
VSCLSERARCKRVLFLEYGSLGVRASFAPFGDYLGLSAPGRSESFQQERFGGFAITPGNRNGVRRCYACPYRLVWSTTRVDSFARERPRSRRSWPGFSSGSGVALRAGKSDWRCSAGVRCWAVSLRPRAPSCGKWPSAWVCGTWSTWRVAQRDDTILNRGSHRTVASPLLSMEVQSPLAHVSRLLEPGHRNSSQRGTKSG